MLQLQAVIALDKSGFTSELSSISSLANNTCQSMMAVFGGVGTEILAMGKAFGPVGAAVATLKNVTSAGMEIEQAMANVASLTNEGAAAIGSFGKIADEATRSTKFGFTDVAAAMQMFAAAGYESADAMTNILKPGLDLAAAGGTSTANAVSVMVSALKTFSLNAKEATNVANLFAGGANVSIASVESLGESMTYAGSVASAYGMSLQETIGVLALYSDKGMQGSVAGTAFAQSMAALTAAAREGKTAIGAALADWNPAAEGMAGAIKRLETAGVSAKDVFGEFGRQGGKAVASLLNSGSAAIVDYTTKVSSVGDAAGVAAQRQDTMKGSLADLKGEVQRLQVVMSSMVSGSLKGFIDGIVEAVQWVTKLMQALTGGDWSTVKTMLVGVFDSALASAKKAFDGIREGAGKIADAFKGINWGDSFSTLKNTAVNVWASIVSESSAALSKITAYLKGQDWGAVWDSVKQGAIMAFNFWYSHVAEVWGKIASYLKNINGAELWEGIKSAAVKVWNEIESIAKTVWPNIQKYAENVFAAIAESGRVAWEAIKQAWNTVDWSKVMDDIKAGFNSAIDTVKAFGKSLAENIGLPRTFSALGDALDTLKVTFSNVAEGAKALFTALSNVNWSSVLKSALTALDTALAGIVKTINLVLASVNGLIAGFQKLSDLDQQFILTVAGSAGLAVAFGTLAFQITAATQAVIAFVSANAGGLLITTLRQLQMGLPIVNAAWSSFIPLTVGAATAAGVLGAGLGLLIRQIPGVADALDNFTVKVGQFIGAVEKEDHSLDAVRKTMREQVIEQTKLKEAQEALTRTVDNNNDALYEQEDAAAEAVNKIIALEKAAATVAPTMDKAAVSTGTATGAISKLAASAAAIGPIIGEFIDDIDKADMAENLKAMGAVMSGTAKQVKELANATNETKIGTTDLFGMLSKFKDMKINAFDVSDFVNAMKQLKAGLSGFSLPEIKLPDFSLFKIPRINTMEMASFVNAVKQLASGLANVNFPDMTPLTDLAFIAIPNLSRNAITDLLHNLGLLKNGLMDIDFGSLGGIDVNITGKAGDSAAMLGEIRDMLKGAKGVIWA